MLINKFWIILFVSLFVIFQSQFVNAACPMVGSKIFEINPIVECIEIRGTPHIVEFPFGATRECMPYIRIYNHCNEDLTAITTDENKTIEKNDWGGFWFKDKMDWEGEFNFTVSYDDKLIYVSGIYGRNIFDYTYCRDYFGNELNCEDINSSYYILALGIIVVLVVISIIIFQKRRKQ